LRCQPSCFTEEQTRRQQIGATFKTQPPHVTTTADDDDEEEEEEEEEEDWESDEDEEDAELDEGLAERLRILADARALKVHAVAFLHPEKKNFNKYFLLEGTDPAVFGRNYFGRYSAPETEDRELADERAHVLAEAAALKKSAVDFLHPEVGVASTDGACFGRNYFGRYSAPETEDDEFADERAEIMEEATALKKSAVDYLHPEIGVKVTDGTCFGRNYFGRYSAPETENSELASESANVLAEAAALKKSAVAFLHPEVGVTASDGACFGRNYFGRFSAPETEDDEFADERAEIMEDAAALKNLAAEYLHPEIGVKVSDGTLFGRNYFGRNSAPETEDIELANDRALVLAEAAALKMAVDCLHPEVGVTSTDGACFGRNYFGRYSAPETEDDEFADERAVIMKEAAALKKYAVDYLHPEIGVKVTDGTCFGRNYFGRYSAPETEDSELANERANVLAEAAALKKSAVDFLHPEIGVKVSDGTLFCRNYFGRYSALEIEDKELADERALVLAEAAALKKMAVDYFHPEVGVTFTDGACFGRNYFGRYSAPETEDDEFEEERAEIMEEAAALKKLAAAVKGANLPSIKSAKLSSLDNNVSVTKRSASSVNLFGLSEEVF